MPALTPAETVVVRSLLAASSEPERQRIRRSGLPPRTYETARRRVFEKGIVIERFVPNAAAFGFPRVAFGITESNRDTRRELETAWSRHRGCALLWSAPSLLLGVFFLRDQGPGSQIQTLTPIGSTPPRTHLIDSDLGEPSVPVYFDFGGAWSRVSGEPGPAEYPRPLLGGPTHVRAGGVGEAPTLLQAARRLVLSPFEGPSHGSRGFHLGSLFHDRLGDRAAVAGLVERRAFLELTSAPQVGGGQLEEIVLVYGSVKGAVGPEQLFRRLVAECHVTPFLYVTDGKQLLMGTIAPAPPGRADESRAPVLPLLNEYMSKIEIIRERVDQLDVPINHRYDKLVTGGPAAP